MRGDCDPAFSEVRAAFETNFRDGLETGAALVMYHRDAALANRGALGSTQLLRNRLASASLEQRRLVRDKSSKGYARISHGLLYSRPHMPAPWLPVHRPRAGSRLRLFCFPYAGGGASLFRPWADVLPAGMELCAVQLPGREERISEPPFTSMPGLMEVLDGALAPLLDRPFALFGHSLGSLLAFELTRHLRRRGGPVPLYLFVSGAPGPGLPRTGPPLHALPEPEFLQVVRQLSGGVSDAVLGDAGFADVWGRLMRADLQLAETYRLLPEPALDVPISAFGGVADTTVSREELALWSEQTRGGFSQHMLPGGHLFVRASYPSIIRVLWQKLRVLVPGL